MPNRTKIWRRGWDLNPRLGFPNTRFRGELFQPLRHLSSSSLANAPHPHNTTRACRYVVSIHFEGNERQLIVALDLQHARTSG